MRQTLSKGMAAAAAATSVLSLYGTTALADSGASSAAEGSPGVLSGNTVQAPVHVPVNACGNSGDLIAALDPAFGNRCGNDTGSGSGLEAAPQGQAVRGHEGSPGGRAETPGDQGSRSGGGPGAYGPPASYQPPTKPSTTPRDTRPTRPHAAPPATSSVTRPSTPAGGPRAAGPGMPPTRPPHQPSTASSGTPSAKPPTLPETGTEGVFAASAGGAALIVGGAILYRRGRALSRR